MARELVEAIPDHEPILTCSQDGCLAFVHQRFPASSGTLGHPTQLRVALVLSGGGRLEQHSVFGPKLESLWSVGQFNVVLPGQTGTYSSPAVEILGLSIDCSKLEEQVVDVRALAPLTAALHRDTTVSAVIHAIQSAAEAKVLSDQFLWVGALTIVRRLTQLAQKPAHLPDTPRPLTIDQLHALMVYVDASKDARPSVQNMAQVLGMDQTRFRRGIQAATGMSPYDFLTHRRMHWASAELERGLSVMYVAQSVGYANASKFSAAFRRVIGCAPSEVRRGLRVGPPLL